MTETTSTDILYFFLNIYKMQMNASGSPGEFVPVAFPDTDTIYEFRLKRGSRWFTRRMSIGPLGEDTGSKSECYKVIYDDVLVVKLPPRPVPDFTSYIKSIRMERQIAEKLGPEIECITPTLSAILKKIPLFFRDAASGLENFEEHCIEKLRTFREYQNYLKIGNRFAFFSSLATYSFLGQIIKNIHFTKPDIHNEILSHISMLEHPVLFEDVYGKTGTSVFYRISEIYASYEEKFALLPGKEKWPQITPYQKKLWFLNRLGEKYAAPDTNLFCEELLSGVNGIIEESLRYENETVRSYRNMVKEIIREKNFQQNKTAMRSIVANLLSLLSILREKGVAVRDLKPDNVFIAGNISENPVLLATPDDYSIGLIDFETAVVYKTEEEEKIAQPMLAGTPSYATPSHLFRNELLRKVYDDLPRILHLQDWQAVNSMIFNVIAGKRLSRETEKLIPGMARIVKEAMKRKMSRAEAFQECNRIFWSGTSGEFYERMETHKAFLQSVIIPLPEPVRRMLTAEAVETLSAISRRIRIIVSAQQIFRSPQSRENLAAADQESLRRWKDEWERNEKVPQTRPDARDEIVRFLDILLGLRQESVQTAAILSLPEQRPVLSAYELMILMFRVVVNAMYKPEWGILCSELPCTGKDGFAQIPDITDEESINIEQTLL
ncbi:MAG: hypothetical protein AB7S75_13420 [Desulfococcaceae bacterium]